jgi:hypothetical protein
VYVRTVPQGSDYQQSAATENRAPSLFVAPQSPNQMIGMFLEEWQPVNPDCLVDTDARSPEEPGKELLERYALLPTRIRRHDFERHGWQTVDNECTDRVQ